VSAVLMTTVSRFHPALVALHWILAFLILADLTVGTTVVRHVPNDLPRKLDVLRMHAIGGTVILTLTLVRLGVRALSSKPARASTGAQWLDHIAWLSHWSLYVAVLGVALSGVAMGMQAHLPEVVFMGVGRLPDSFWVYPMRYVHMLFSRLLMLLVALHVAGALYHTFILRDRLLARMGFGKRLAPQSRDSYR
jgi:cytochrome b561